MTVPWEEGKGEGKGKGKGKKREREEGREEKKNVLNWSVGRGKGEGDLECTMDRIILEKSSSFEDVLRGFVTSNDTSQAKLVSFAC